MIEMNSALPLDRNSAATAIPLDALRPVADNPAAAAPRQAEVPPGVEVQISTAAREAAARDPVPVAANATTPGNPGAGAPDAATAQDAAQETGNTAATVGASQDQNRALRLFNETAGIGLEQPNPSPLRDIA